MYYYVHLLRSEVIDLLYLDLPGLLGLEDGLDDYWGRLAVWNFRDGQGVLVYLLDLCTYLNLSAFASAAVFRAVGGTSCQEIRENLEIPALKYIDGCIDEFIEVMRENL